MKNAVTLAHLESLLASLELDYISMVQCAHTTSFQMHWDWAQAWTGFDFFLVKIWTVIARSWLVGTHYIKCKQHMLIKYLGKYLLCIFRIGNQDLPCNYKTGKKIKQTVDIVRFLRLHSRRMVTRKFLAIKDGCDITWLLHVFFFVISLNALTADIKTKATTWKTPGIDFNALVLSTGSYSETNSFQLLEISSLIFSQNSGIADGFGNNLASGLWWLNSVLGKISSELFFCSTSSKSPMLMDFFPVSNKWWTLTRT